MMPKGHEAASQARFKKYMTMMDSMTAEELDNPKGISDPSRIKRVAIGSGRRIEEVISWLIRCT